MPDLRLFPAPPVLRRVVIVAFVATFALFLVFQWHDRPLSPYTIVSLELAWTPEQAGPMLAAWGAAGQQVARESLLLDFACMPAYAFLFSGVGLVAARRARGNLQKFGLWVTAAPFVAWAGDITQSMALLRVLATPQSLPAAALQVAGPAASLKYELLLVVLGYVLVAFIVERR